MNRFHTAFIVMALFCYCGFDIISGGGGVSFVECSPSYNTTFDLPDITDSEVTIALDASSGCIISGRNFGNAAVTLQSAGAVCRHVIFENCEMRSFTISNQDDPDRLAGDINVTVTGSTLSVMHITPPLRWTGALFIRILRWEVK